MQKMIVLKLAILMLFLSGCTSMNARETNDNKIGKINSQNVKYESERQQREQLEVVEDPTKDYYQSDEEGIGTGGNERNFYPTVDTREIAQLLAKRKDVQNSQVASFTDGVVVVLQLNNYSNPNVANELEREIAQIVPNKKVIIYTDDISWNRMKKLDSGLQQRKMGENVENWVEKYFNVDMKD